MKIKVKDPIIKRVIKKIIGRSKTGFKKYGVTLQDDPADLDTWLNHLQEELMDAVNYIERAREELKREQTDKWSSLYYPPYPVCDPPVLTCTCGTSIPCSLHNYIYCSRDGDDGTK